jgi:hypothetical protein
MGIHWPPSLSLIRAHPLPHHGTEEAPLVAVWKAAVLELHFALEFKRFPAARSSAFLEVKPVNRDEA